MAKKIETEEAVFDPSFSLLQEFKDKCPGTYKHSQAVSDMAEAVAQKLDLDVEVMKMAALYHDIGKMANPGFFGENQKSEEDPHDDLDPFMSLQIITRHVADSVLYMVNESKIPRDVIEIVSQHHGTTVTKYFYQKSGEKNEEIYRYPGRKPTSLESAVLMICDCVEAGAQARFQAHKDVFPDEVVRYIVDSLIDDGQLDEVIMRLGDLKKIKDVLVKELEGMFPKRVDYDTEEKSEPKKGAKRKTKPY